QRGRSDVVCPAAAGADGGIMAKAVSPLDIFGAGRVPGLGIAGAASAVVAYNVAMAAVLLRAIWAASSPARPTFQALVPRWRYASEILRISVPSAAGTLLSNLTFIILTALV